MDEFIEELEKTAQRLYRIELIPVSVGQKRIGICDMISRSIYRDTTTKNPDKELIDWLAELGVKPLFFMKVDKRIYALTDTLPLNLIKAERQ